ncbi:hypothetical protein D9758_016633 [Tetrapyrgos nigripes]|uniref:chitin synthase n=1 Tax=Tetrapyrgos nigripes TaxID=182062 RepID=A0A8H5BY82_9AGAR|nr:hypothetical protein D9758_016633 [Tetrapyrgos nigripes]
MVDLNFHITGIHIGNQPGVNRFLPTAILGFAFEGGGVLFAFLLAFEGIDQIIDYQGIDAGDLFDNTIFRNIVLSLVATLGLYLVASLIFFEPWHMITSFFQYMLVTPSYISVLKVYAFANVHNVSWNQGRQQSNYRTRSVDAAVPDQPIDIDANYEDALHVLGTKAPKLEGKVDAATQQEDYYRTVGTNVLLAWTLSNGLLATAMASATEGVYDIFVL